MTVGSEAMPVRFEMDGVVGVITLASPGRRNALSRELVAGVLGALRSEEAARARAFVIAGEGSAFCAGADIGDLLEAGWVDGTATAPDPVDLFAAIAAEPRIVVAAVHGMALGGGFELSLACDLVVAGPDATFALPELEHGVIPNTALVRLRRLVGPRKTLELVATGRRVAAPEAAALGLVASIVPAAGLRASAVALAAEIAGRAPPGALAATKGALSGPEPDGWDEVRRSLKGLPAAEWREGLSAFMQKRRPDYEQFWRDDANRRSVQDL